MRQTTSGATARKLLPGGGNLLDSSRRLAGETLSAIESSILAVFNDRAISGSPAESLRTLAACRVEADADRVARSMVILSAYRAEQSSPGAGHAFLQLLSGRRLSVSEPRRMVEDDLAPLVGAINDPTVESLVVEAVRQSGPTGNVSVALGAITHLSVEESASFPAIVSPSFSSARSLTIRKVVAYDGVIESVGQVNSFLEDCFREKAQVVLLARAFASEVASTLFLNNQRGNFDIIPVTPEVSFDGEFTIHDIAAITGYEDTSKVSLALAGQGCEVIVEGGKLKIGVRRGEARDNLLRRLRKEMEEFRDGEVVRMLGQRVARISGRRVSVCIGSEFGDTRDIAKEKFDYGMRCYLSARRMGVIEVDGKVLPGDSLRIARESHESFTRLLRNTGGSLVIDKEVAMAKRRGCKRR